MIPVIIESLTRLLYGEFGTNTDVWTENIPQGFQMPCFFVSVSLAAEKPYINQRTLRQHSVLIQYFPNIGKNAHQEMDAIAARLFLLLEYLPLPDGGLLLGRERRYEVEKNTLFFGVEYNCFVYKKQEVTEKMETLTHHIINHNEEERL